MPHAILEYSQNVVETVDHHEFFRRLHEIIVSSGPFSLADIKSRVVRHDHFYVADGNPHHVFAHLSISVLEGRDVAIRRALAEGALALLREAYAVSFEKLNCHLSVEVREMARATYLKVSSDAPPA